MELKRLKLAFGKLKKEYGFAPGLNLILEDNETGKSTFIEALVALLYDLPKAELSLFKPWAGEGEGGDFSGQLEFAHQNKDYRIERDFQNDRLLVTLEPGGKNITQEFSPKKEGREKLFPIGDKLLGIKREEFCRTVLAKQEESQLQAPELTCLTSLVQAFSASAKSDSTAAQAIEKLEKALSKYQGKIIKEGKLENEIKEVKIKISGIESSLAALTQQRESLADRESRLEKQQAQLENLKQTEVKRQKELELETPRLLELEYQELKARKNETEKQRAKDSQEQIRLKEKLKFQQQKITGYQEKISLQQLEILKAQQEAQAYQKKQKIAALGAAIGAVLSLLGFWQPVLFRLGGVVLLAGIFLFLALRFLQNQGLEKLKLLKTQEQRLKQEEQLTQLEIEELNQQQVILPTGSLPEECEQFLNRLLKEHPEFKALEPEASSEQLLRQKREQEKKLELLKQQIYSQKEQQSESKDELRELKAEINSQLKNYQQNYPKLRDEKEELAAYLEKAELYKLALEKALLVLKNLAQKVHKTWAEELNQRVNRLLPYFAPPYRDLYFNQNLEFNFKSAEPQKSFYSSGKQVLLAEQSLSKGTLDQLYLAIRLAISDYLSGDESLPLLLDEPFAHTDDARFKKAMDFLAEKLAKDHQIILLSCHKLRFQNWLKDQKSSVNLIPL